MAALPDTEVFRGAVARELRLQFIRSLKRKVLMLAVAVVAIAVVVGLDRLKVQLVDSREKPYLAADVTRAIAQQNPELAAAAKKLRQDQRYAEADAVFAALLGQTGYASEAAAEQAAIRAGYKDRLKWTDTAIRNAVVAEPPPDGQAADGKKTPLATLKMRRGDLIAARAAELSEAEQNSAARTAMLRRAFDAINVAEAARSDFRVSTNARMNRFLENVVDPSHPLSIIYDVLWYAGLVIGVLAFVALLLTPLFKALPVTGAEEPIVDQVRSLFARGPRGFGAGAVRIAAMTIGTAAIVSVATTAPSSPLVESALLTSSAVEAEAPEQKKMPETSGTREQQGGTTARTDPSVQPHLPGDGPGGGGPPEIRTVDELQKDPRIDDLLASVTQLEADSASHQQALADQKETLGKLAPLPERVEKLRGDEQEQVEKLDDFFEVTNTGIADAKSSAAAADDKAELARRDAAALGAQFGNARQYLEERANSIDEGIALPYKVGERSGFLTSLLSFERYRVTAASVKFVEKAGGPEEVVAAMRMLEGGGDLSNDALRLALRQELCGASRNCELHVAWRDTVLRAARRQ